jgi:hypothetical protein
MLSGQETKVEANDLPHIAIQEALDGKVED